MDKAKIAQLSDDDLAKQLRLLKEDIGPITPNTRRLYERRLIKSLMLEQASSCTIPYTPPNMDHVSLSETQNDNKHNSVTCEELSHTNGSVVTVMHGVSSDGDVHSEAGDSAIFFGVQLQADAPQSLGENTLIYSKQIAFGHEYGTVVIYESSNRNKTYT